MEQFLIEPEYPSGSLDFLKQLHSVNESEGNIEATLKLNVAIVGAGLGGLASGLALARSGHSVTIYEAAPALGEVGAGIQLAPNSTRHLRRWGVEKDLKDLTVEPTSLDTHRWEDGQVIGRLHLHPIISETYKAPYLQMHRSDLHTALKNAALRHGASIRVSSAVQHYDFEKSSLTLTNGEIVTADLIIAADGVNSLARRQFFDGEDLSELISGLAMYRGTLDANLVKDIPELQWLMKGSTQHIWIGPYRHIITYGLRQGNVFNFVLMHPETREPSEWKGDNFHKHMLATYQGWDPGVVKLISLIEAPTKWPIKVTPPLDKWSSDSGRFLMIGDAAHAMVPWIGQGAAMAIEDAAALAELLRLIPSKDSLPMAMKIYESVRIPRTRRLREASLLNGYLLHLPDGCEQKARDAASMREVEGKPFTTSSQQWSDPSTQRWIFGYDACEEIRKAWYGPIKN